MRYGPRGLTVVKVCQLSKGAGYRGVSKWADTFRGQRNRTNKEVVKADWLSRFTGYRGSAVIEVHQLSRFDRTSFLGLMVRL